MTFSVYDCRIDIFKWVVWMYGVFSVCGRYEVNVCDVKQCEEIH